MSGRLTDKCLAGLLEDPDIEKTDMISIFIHSLLYSIFLEITLKCSKKITDDVVVNIKVCSYILQDIEIFIYSIAMSWYR